ncbi:helix-turn-helix domain-containing protein [Brucella anthropi]|jgi:transcriptional regulator with XRE-family HTH domain|uniref:Helix-turn-helix transcriptional regulator n=2 Tax=Brucella anthropi TaxID=529 RepID=A0A6I0DN57_BRUAN|nr:helix-turn-helix transcriptional regulator [Brucella anthropi]KAB2789783.1 helix-turn-helix transcriptional regulator [Brucella anthropi]KAB2797432.1 helix-turn-helix transcriptional regulator [Brucella anthropi]
MNRIMKRWDDVEKYVSEDHVIAFQDTLRSALEERGMSHSDLANMLGVSRSRVSQLFMEGVNPSLRYCALVLFRLGYTIEFKKVEPSGLPNE